jgi:hypothetical protein
LPFIGKIKILEIIERGKDSNVDELVMIRNWMDF